ncbi:MAG TPA: DUF5696 domain-containing protein [Dictyoglomaceae bacterium]|nr:DUF5696 domain-containing protein [Dictyoglomaceae bacterium]
MKSSKLINICSIFLLVIFIFIAPIYSQNNGFQQVAENEKYLLLFNKETAGVAIRDKSTGKIFYQFPQDWEQDPSMGVTKFSIPSHIVVEMADEEAKSSVYNTYALGVMRDNFKVKNIKDGIRIDYEFPTQGLLISIEFVLTSYGLQVRIPMDSIREEGDLKLNRIWVLPYFLSGSRKDDGYLVVPDGSGAIVRFDQRFGIERGFEIPIYGYDYGLPLYDMSPKVEGIKLPVFGVKKGDLGILGVIESGDLDASIACYAAGNSTSYFRVYPVFNYRNIHKFLLYERESSTGQSGEVVDVLVNKFSPYTLKNDIVINYFLFTGKDVDYSSMAKFYRDYLIRNGVLRKEISEKKGLPFNLSIISSIKIKTTKAGVPVIEVFPLTTFDETINILQDFKEKGIKNINLIMKGYQPGGYLSKITNGVKFEAKLGGEKGFKKLLAYCEQNHIKITFTAEIIEVHEQGNGFSVTRDANRYLNNGVAFLYKWDPVTKKKNRDYDPWFLVLPNKLPYYLNNFLRDLDKYGLNNVFIENMGNYIYSQNKSPNLLSKEDVAILWKETLSTYKEEYSFNFTSGNFYILSFAKMIVDMPLDSSNFAIETEPIPFYQMVIHGYIPYSGKSGNLRENQKKEFLRMIEYGAIPYYTFTYEDSSYFKKSFYNEMVSSHYKDWIDQAANEYHKIKDLYSYILNIPIDKHQKIMEGVYRVLYKNNVEVVVNYNKKAVNYKGKKINGEDFIFLLGEN